MNKIIYLVFILILVSCKSANRNNNDSIINELSENKIDTVFFNYDKSGKYEEFATIEFQNSKKNKEGVFDADLKVKFYQENNLVYIDKIKIKNFEINSEWYGYYALDSINKAYKALTFGYPACGYTHYNYLYFIDKNSAKRIHEFNSTFDGGWFTATEFLRIDDKRLVLRTASFWPDESNLEDDQFDEEIGKLEYSDSIVISFEKNKWRRIYKTPKGKIYKTKRQSYKEMYPE